MRRKVDVAFSPWKACEMVESAEVRRGRQSRSPRPARARQRADLQKNADSPKHDTTLAIALPLRLGPKDFAVPFAAAASEDDEPTPTSTSPNASPPIPHV